MPVSVGQNGAVTNLVFLDLFDGLVGLGHGEPLSLRLYAVTGGYVEHLANARRATDRASGHGSNGGYERKGLQRHRRGRDADETQSSRGPQCLDVDTPVLVGIYGAENEVQCAGDFLEGAGLAGVHETMRAQGAGLGLFCGGGGERRDLRAKDPGKLNGHVAQPADANYADARRRVNDVAAQRSEEHT